jgi:hypothetical protein
VITIQSLQPGKEKSRGGGSLVGLGLLYTAWKEEDMVEEGTKAPEISLPDSRGEQVSLGDYAGKWLVLYFYPKDNTSGCTREALDFSKLKEGFEKRFSGPTVP